MALPIFLYIILIVAGFTYKKSKAIEILILLFAWVLFGWNYMNYDIENYEIRFNSFDSADSIIGVSALIEPGFKTLCWLGNYVLGLSFQQWHALIVLLCYLSIYSFIRKFKMNQAMVMASYLFTIFIIDVIQFRFFIAMSITLCGFSVLFSDMGRKKKAVYYFLIVLLASSIHASSLFCLIFVLILYDIKPVYVALLLFVLAISLTTLFLFFDSYFEVEKAESYEGQTGTLGAVFNSLLQIANALFISYIPNKVVKTNSSFSDKLIHSDYIKRMNWLLLLLIPLYFQSGQFSRVFRFVLLGNFCYLSVVCSNKRFSYYLYLLLIANRIIRFPDFEFYRQTFLYNYIFESFSLF